MHVFLSTFIVEFVQEGFQLIQAFIPLYLGTGSGGDVWTEQGSFILLFIYRNTLYSLIGKTRTKNNTRSIVA